jgi:hypothetical protein
VDALRPYLAQIEAHILEQAGVEFVPSCGAGQAGAGGRLKAFYL